jgi:hypothetical protein
MKKTLIIIAILFAVLALTNPSEKSHKDAVSKIVVDRIKAKSKASENIYEIAGQNIGIMMAEKMVDGMVSRENYLFFSFTKINNKKESYAGIGILGYVYVFNLFNN